MPSKKTIAVILILGVMGLVILVQGVIIGLPVLAERLIRDRLPGLPGGFSPGFFVESIGVNKATIRGLSLGHDIRADALELFYSWGQGQSFEITQARISGLAVHASVDDDQKVHVNGLVLNQTRAGEQAKGGALSREQVAALAPFIPKQVILDHSTFVLDYGGRSLEFPFYVRTVLTPDAGLAKVHAVVYAMGHPLRITAEADMQNGLNRFTLDSRGLSPQSVWAGLTPRPLPVTLLGPADLHGELLENGQWQVRVSNLGVQGRAVPRGRVDAADALFDPLTRNLTLLADLKLFDIFQSPLPLKVSLSGSLNDIPGFDLSITNAPVKELALTRNSFFGKLPGELSSVRLSGPDIYLNMAGIPDDQKLTFRVKAGRAGAKGPPGEVLTAGFTLSAQGRGNLLKDVFSQEMDWTLTAGKFDFNAEDAALSLSGKAAVSGNFKLSSRQYLGLELAGVQARLENLRGRSGQGRVSIGKAGISVRASGSTKGQSLVLKADFSPVSIRQGNRQAEIPRCGVAGRVVVTPDGLAAFDLKPWVDQASVFLPDQGLEAGELAFSTRLTRPFIPGSSGELTIGTLSFENRLNARFSSRLDQVNDQTWRLAGTLSSPDLINKKLEVNIKAGLHPDFWADIHGASRHFVISEASLNLLAPQITIPGDIYLDTTADAWASYRRGQFTSRAALEIHDGSVSFPESNLSAQGITGLLGIRDLMKMESYPGQVLAIDRISVGQFRFENATLRFRIENPKSMGIENLKFNWCNGLVSSEAVHLPSAQGPIRLILFCDRLEMAALLNQMGAFDAQGGGTLSGRIPVTYTNGDIAFENGFLFSTPGKGGRVAVRDLDRFMAGFPKGTPESSYLEMAGEALKDFQYNWATLKMNSQGDTLTVNMELDGKPSRILPFEFRKDVNAFVRVDASSPGAHFQGIKLDLNLKLPFNQVAKFGSKIRGLMD